jgi:predicted transcriptional regulator
VGDGERAAWEKVYELGRTVPADLATALGADESDAEEVLNSLHRRRLVMRTEDGYIAVGGIGIGHD